MRDILISKGRIKAIGAGLAAQLRRLSEQPSVYRTYFTHFNRQNNLFSALPRSGLQRATLRSDSSQSMSSYAGLSSLSPGRLVANGSRPRTHSCARKIRERGIFSSAQHLSAIYCTRLPLQRCHHSVVRCSSAGVDTSVERAPSVNPAGSFKARHRVRQIKVGSRQLTRKSQRQITRSAC